MADIDRITNDQTGLGYVIKQLRSIAENTYGRAALNRRNAETATIVKAGIAELAKQIASKPDLAQIEAAINRAVADLDKE